VLGRRWQAPPANRHSPRDRCGMDRMDKTIKTNRSHRLSTDGGVRDGSWGVRGIPTSGGGKAGRVRVNYVQGSQSFVPLGRGYGAVVLQLADVKAFVAQGGGGLGCSTFRSQGRRLGRPPRPSAAAAGSPRAPSKHVQGGGQQDNSGPRPTRRCVGCENRSDVKRNDLDGQVRGANEVRGGVGVDKARRMPASGRRGTPTASAGKEGCRLSLGSERAR